MRDPGSNPMGVLMWNQDSPVSDVLLHNKQNFISLWEKTASAFNTQRVLMWNRDSPVSFVSLHFGDLDMDDQCGVVWAGLCPEPSLGRCADNVIIPLDLTQLFCPGFTLASGPPSGFITDIVGCWGGALWRACNLTAFIYSSTGPVVHPFASCHEGPGFKPHGGTSVKPGFSC
jgi:hypothetical protein